MNLNKDSHTIGKDSMNTIAETLHIFFQKKKKPVQMQKTYLVCKEYLPNHFSHSGINYTNSCNYTNKLNI